MTAAEPILAVSGVHKSFGGLRAVAGASFSVERGSITALIGPNGAGKTTLFDLISGFGRPDAGTVTYDGHAIAGLPAHRIARLGLVRTFQLTRVFAGMTLRENMMLAAAGQPGEHLPTLLLRRSAARRREREVGETAATILERFGLASKAEHYAGTLSGGQRKLLELARVLMAAPKMILLDEPMAGVNPVLGRQVLDHIDELRRTRGITALFVEHNMDIVMTRADKVVVMARGAVIAEGTADMVRRDPAVIEAYLGSAAAVEQGVQP